MFQRPFLSKMKQETENNLDMTAIRIGLGFVHCVTTALYHTLNGRLDIIITDYIAVIKMNA